MDTTHGLAAILRDARKSALLRMRSEIYFTTAFAGDDIRGAGARALEGIVTDSNFKQLIRSQVFPGRCEASNPESRDSGSGPSDHPGMTFIHTSAFSRRNASEFCMTLPPITEGAGNAGCPLHPQPRVQNKKAHERIHHRFTGATRRFPRNGFNGLFRALPGDRAFLPPSSADHSANLTPASGRQDHTALPSAAKRHSSWRCCVHRIPFRVRDDRDTPLIGNGTARTYNQFDFGKTEIFFRSGLDNAETQAVADLPVGQITSLCFRGLAPVTPSTRPGDQRPASDATHSISISIAGLGSACTTQVVRAG